MTLLVIPGLFFLLAAPMPGPPAKALANCSRISRALNQQIALVEVDGTEHKGVLTAADGDQVTVRVGSVARTCPRGSVVSAERMRDGRIDGAIKGALFGLFLSAMASQGLTRADDANRLAAKSVVSFAAIGYLLDLEETNRRPLYRASGTAALKPAVKLSLRF